MPVATYRFYEELNVFLAPERRKRSFTYASPPNATVKHVIEALGVPHTEVELIFVNDASVDLDCRIGDGDRVSVYPMFEAFDVTPLLRLRPAPLRRTAFLADAHLGGLARHLRLLGFDTQLAAAQSDDQIVAAARGDHRIVLTRDRAPLMRRELTHGCYVHATRSRAQAVELLVRLDLTGAVAPFTRCLRCNTGLQAARPQELRHRVPASVAESQQQVLRCPGCNRIYWQGSHWRRMQHLVASCLADARRQQRHRTTRRPVGSG